MDESDFSYKTNLVLAMLRQNVGIDAVTVDGDLVKLPLLAEDVLTGQLGTDVALAALQRVCLSHPAECRLAVAQIEHIQRGAAYGVDSEPSSSSIDVAGIISASGSALSSVVGAFTNQSTTTTVNTNTTTTSSSAATSSSKDYTALYVGGGVILLAALMLLRKN